MKKVITAVVAFVIVALMALGYMQASHHSTQAAGKLDPKELIFEHLGDAYGWEVPFSHELRIPLPVIVKDCAGSWHCFMSCRVQDGAEYEGFRIAEGGDHSGKIVGTDGQGNEYRPLDLSITKDAAGIFIAALLVICMVMKVRNWYKNNGLKAPRKGTAALEVCVDFVYNDTIRPIMGSDAPKYGPYLLTVFFFILTMNLLGLTVIFPGGANLTGNLAVTMTLAVCTFLVTNLTGTREYWKEIFWPDVPVALKAPVPLMPIIEIFGIFTKPVALMIRLFANMMGGHMVVIVFTLLIFIFGAYGVAIGSATAVFSLAFSLFMLLLDTLVSFIQAYVFTILSTMFISMAHVRHHEMQPEQSDNK
ncbi:MAG: F0F1 ATP synthase subunit A [Bacteroidales bacterium]|nr:F0F1 ATP synthase subunit A [Bacteroidales bacterium]MDY3912427.1 F0F1 ATP synthase subunit A [Sodaliphilus sp.]